MKYPVLYPSTEKNFENNGIGILIDCISCFVIEELNGAFEVEFQYPIKGVFYSEILEGRYIKCKPNDEAEPQIFKIYRSTKPIRGVVKFYGEHISYELNGYPIDSFNRSASANGILQGILSASLIPHRFTGYSYINTTGKVDLKAVSVRSALGGVKGSILDKFGGEYEFNNFQVIHRDRRGSDNGVRIAYGKNLTNLNQNNDISAVYTGVYPFARYTKTPSGLTFDEVTEEVTVTLSEKIIYSENASKSPTQKILIKDFTEFFTEEEAENDNSFESDSLISEEDLRRVVKDWLSNTDLVNPKLSITLSYEDLRKAEEYKGKPIFDAVRLGDTVTVDHTDLGVSASARVAKTKYDCLRQRYDSITVGSVRSNIADTILGSSESIQSAKKEFGQQNLTNRAQLELAIKAATELLNGANGGVWELLDENGDGINDAWILRSYDSQKFVKATRDGIGVTVDGGRNYQTAITAEGIHGESIIAGSVTAEKMNADGIVAKDVNISGTLTMEEDTENIVQVQPYIKRKYERKTIVEPDEISVQEKISREEELEAPGFWRSESDIKTGLSNGRLNTEIEGVYAGVEETPDIIRVSVTTDQKRTYGVYLDLQNMTLKVHQV